ncbi:asparagine synthase (glutamine-hydrolyzing) [Azohydromonas aeria]|uniref:asparagine synthase (glutamine-hydrolyzing) n=1 Tax=Azohydromonas aeria TaxID=2590212 RepID=UPI0012FA0899|nr:asparagine synthase (glutamine-hydrolyzing) [Azohydromonas aeria]
MCGISGIYDRSGKPVPQDMLARMTAAIGHRGPDGEGQFLNGNVALGHRRLSIIDLEGGTQPMGNEDDSIQVVFNGEIYNFIELRAELQSFGHVFKTSSDTEVIVHAYEQWGIDCVKRFNGMFAFALFDMRERSVFLARDHLGIKPLYYTVVGSQVLFASEIKALIQHPEFQRDVDIDSLAELFTFRFVPSPKTLFRNVFRLPPGHRMLISREQMSVSRFWDHVPQFRQNWREEALIEEYLHLLQDSIKIQLRSDVPLGLFLSSGIDSSALLAVMKDYSSGPVQTFTIGFNGGEKTNEVADAHDVARQFGAEHHSLMLSSQDYLDHFERYMRDLEEPVGHEAAPAFYFLAQLTRSRVKVALTGQGADEPWAGYDRYKGVQLSQYYSRLPRAFTDGMESSVGRLPLPMERFKRGLASLGERDVLTRFTKIYSFFSADMKAQLFEGSLKDRFLSTPYGTKEALRRLHTDVAQLDPLSQMLYIDTRANLPDDLLMVADKTSMANSLEVRVPFLDYRLVQFIENLPPRLKLRGWTGKYLHKRALASWLPSEIVNRKKKGFAHPVAQWLRQAMKPLVDDCLLSANSSLTRYFNQGYLREMVRKHQEGKEQYMRHIFLLVSLELWHRTFFPRQHG